MKILDDVQRAMELARTGGDQALWELLLEIRQEAGKLVDENLRLQEKTFEAMPPLPEIMLERNAVWKKAGGGREDTPYCMRCYHAEKALMPLAKMNEAAYRCPECKESFTLYPENLGGPQSGGRRASADMENF